MRRVPTNSFYGSAIDILRSVPKGTSDDAHAFESAFARYTGARHAFLVGSGTAALFVILSALKRFSGGTEVVLPAYTVPTLTLAVKRAGLVTRLCDIDRATFNMDPEKLAGSVTKRTLAVVPVHMFGLPMDLSPIREATGRRGSFVVEDAAQAPGAVIHGTRVGTGGDACFFSLCKGKIVSTFRGGVITTDRDDLAGAIRDEIRKLPAPGPLFDVRLFVTLLLLAFTVRPVIYGALFPLIAPLKSTTVHTRFTPTRGTDFEARLGMVQLAHVDDQIKARTRNGRMLMEGLAGTAGIVLPEIAAGAVPAFNHLPILVEDEGAIAPLRRRLLTCGIDTARMYERPIHHVYDLGYKRSPDPFPHATYVARHLVVLPTHAQVTERDATIMIETIRGGI
jgi:perosamine synthetase